MWGSFTWTNCLKRLCQVFLWNMKDMTFKFLGKKGISLTLDQLQQLKSLFPELDNKFPSFSSSDKPFYDPLAWGTRIKSYSPRHLTLWLRGVVHYLRGVWVILFMVCLNYIMHSCFKTEMIYWQINDNVLLLTFTNQFNHGGHSNKRWWQQEKWEGVA